MEQAITKDILRNELHAGERPAIELLYARYSSLLFPFILQFTPDRQRAESLLITVFSRLADRLQEACESPLSIYCWLQSEARKIVLESGVAATQGSEAGPDAYYAALLQDAPELQQRVFHELYIRGRKKEELARELGKEVPEIDRLLRESLLLIRKKMA